MDKIVTQVWPISRGALAVPSGVHKGRISLLRPVHIQNAEKYVRQNLDGACRPTHVRASGQTSKLHDPPPRADRQKITAILKIGQTLTS